MELPLIVTGLSVLFVLVQVYYGCIFELQWESPLFPHEVEEFSELAEHQ